MKFTVLILTTTRWVPTVRLAMALREAGFAVEIVCPSGHPVRHTGAARRIHRYNGLRPLASFARAIAASEADLIVPGDDLAARYLHQLHEERRADDPVRRLIERSLGMKESFPIVSARAAFIEVAREEGIRVPETRIIDSLESLRTWTGRHGFPFVLKADGTSGGEGVRIVESEDAAKGAFAHLAGPPLLARALKRTLLDRDSALLWPSMARTRPVVNAQSFVSGREATSAVACWNGVVLASLHFEVIRKTKTTGHATVVRAVEHAEMAIATERMVRRLCLSGLHGFDFMLDAETNDAHLIEINPRSTQIGHFPLGAGRDLPAALYAALSGKPARTTPPMTGNDTIALFPNEWLRDATSPFLLSAFHDVPWQEPQLVKACVLNQPRR